MNKNFNDSFGPSQTATGVVQNINKGESILCQNIVYKRKKTKLKKKNKASNK